ncbi:MAG: SCP2 sterol-binding domain-containing protein [Myxococcales bacterium]|nr:MAG: SCP2 sterol-binding domain-containing protein [Myxococcales bacterium]
MAYQFPSPEWTAAYKDAVNANQAYEQASADWTHGAVAMVVKADKAIGLENDAAMLLDVHQGKCRNTEYFTNAEQAKNKAAFVIEAPYPLWKEVVQGKVEPIKAMMQNKLKLTKGALPTMIRYVEGSKQLVQSASQVPTEFVA